MPKIRRTKKTAEATTIPFGGLSPFGRYRHIGAPTQDREWKQSYHGINGPLL